jgi:DNA modification methylase
VKTDGTNENKKTVAVCERHPTAPGRELARHLIGECTKPGDIVAEVYPSSDTVLVSAWEQDELPLVS